MENIFKTIELKKLNKYKARIELENKEQLNTYLNRLANIANRNDAISEMFKGLNVRFENLVDNKKVDLEENYNSIIMHLDNSPKLTKEIIKEIGAFDKATEEYVNEANALEEEFKVFYAKGDELRVRLQTLQDRFRSSLDEINNFASSISICQDSLNDYMALIEKKFEEYDDDVSQAKYQEAEKLYKVIDSMISNIYGNVERIATYCKMIEVEIPEKLVVLKRRNDELESQGIVVRFANVNEFIINTNNLLEQCKEDFKGLNFGDFEDIANEFSSKYSEVNAKLDQEVSSKGVLENKYEITLKRIKEIEADFIKTKRNYQGLKEYYKLANDSEEKFMLFEKNATLLSSLKIEYDGYIFSANNHPASFMLEKVNTLDELCATVSNDIKFFNDLFINVRTYVEQTYNRLTSLSTDLIKLIGMVRYYKFKDVYVKYIERENEILENLKKISVLLTSKPIDIEEIQKNFPTVAYEADSLLVSIQNDLNNYQTVENSIIFANPLRNQYKEVDSMLNEIEVLFKNGKYREAQDKLDFIFNNYHTEAYNSFKG